MNIDLYKIIVKEGMAYNIDPRLDRLESTSTLIKLCEGENHPYATACKIAIHYMEKLSNNEIDLSAFTGYRYYILNE